MSHLINVTNTSNYKFLQPSTDSYQDITTSWADVSGSQISYTPTINSDFIIYEFIFLQSQHPDVSDTNVYMEGYYKTIYSDDNGSNWSEFSNSRNFIGAKSPSKLRIRGLFSIKQCIPYWNNTERIIKLQVKKSSDTYVASLHINKLFYDTTGLLASDRYIRPVVSCYSIKS